MYTHGTAWGWQDPTRPPLSLWGTCHCPLGQSVGQEPEVTAGPDSPCRSWDTAWAVCVG